MKKTLYGSRRCGYTDSVGSKLQALVYDILPSLEEGAGKRCSECVWAVDDR